MSDTEWTAERIAKERQRVQYFRIRKLHAAATSLSLALDEIERIQKDGAQLRKELGRD